MVYGYCTDQVDGTSFIGGIFDQSATSYPYSEGLAIGGTSGNLLWKGKKVLTVDDSYVLPTASSTLGGVKTTSTVTSTSGLTACPIISGVVYYKDTNTTYTHPTTSGNKHIPSGGSSGQILRWSADGTAVWGADNNTTYSAATTSAAGLMSAADKTKLDGIATGANKYSLPTASSSTLGGVKIGTGIAISSGVISNSGVRSVTTGSTNGTISVNTNGSSAEVAVKGLGSNAYTSTAYLPLAGGTLTGRLIIDYSNDAAAATSSSGSLIIGSTSGEHISIDTNEIMAKSNGTTASNLNIQIDGGNIVLGKGGSTTTVNTAATLKGSVNINNSTNTPTIQFMPTYNSSAVMGVLRYEGPYSTTADDGTVTYTNRNRFCLRAYSAGASPYTSRTSYYYSYCLPSTPASLTANKTYYFAIRTNSSCNASTEKRYVLGMSGTDGSMNYNSSVYTSGSVLYGACWNDYAEYRDQDYELKPGYITYCDDDGKLKYTTEHLQHFEGVVSDTFGFSIGETDNCKTPLAVSGRVLVYCDPEDRFHAGDCVCAGPNGIAYRMTREEIIEFPDRIVGTVSEIPTYETWGSGNVAVDGRIWIKVR
jgi:hypothetical protein